MLKILAVLLCAPVTFLAAPDIHVNAATIPAVAIAGIAAHVEPIFVSVAAAAEILATSRSEIYQRIARGELEAVKDGSRTKITFESLKRIAATLPKANIKLYIPRSQ